MTKGQRSDSFHTGPCRAGSFPEISRRSNGRRSAGKSILQRWLRAKDEPERSFIDIAVEVNLRLTALDKVDSCLRKLLGSERSLTKEKIRKNHRQLMLLNHPDRGGSPYLATKVNEAKEFLEKHQ